MGRSDQGEDGSWMESADHHLPGTGRNHGKTWPGAGKERSSIKKRAVDRREKIMMNKDGKIYGALIQGDLDYAGVLTQLIKEKIDVSKVTKSLFDIDYADFFNIEKNFEFSYK